MSTTEESKRCASALERLNAEFEVSWSETLRLPWVQDFLRGFPAPNDHEVRSWRAELEKRS